MHADYALVEYNSVLKIPCCFYLNEELPVDLPERSEDGHVYIYTQKCKDIQIIASYEIEMNIV